MKCGICKAQGKEVTDQMRPVDRMMHRFSRPNEPEYMRLIWDASDLAVHKRYEHRKEYLEIRGANRDKRAANQKTREQHESIEEVARQEGREALAMPVVTRVVTYQGTGPEGRVVYGMHDTSELRSWYLRSNGSVHFGQYGEARLMDVEPQASYTALQNTIDALQAQQMQLLSLAFEAGPEITVEHLEAVEASGGAAVERLRAE